MGEFTLATDSILEEIRAQLPDAYDELMLFKLKGAGEESATGEEGSEDERLAAGPADMAPQPYESYNYVVLIFRNDIDWSAAMTHFDLKPVVDEYTGKTIGMGRVVDGATYLRQVVKG